MFSPFISFFFFFNDTATTEIYTLSLHDALPILHHVPGIAWNLDAPVERRARDREVLQAALDEGDDLDRKSTRLNSSHLVISYAVFCLKKKKNLVLSMTHCARPKPADPLTLHSVR